VPPQLEQIVLKAMAREPEDRFQTAAEMRRALAAAVAATPLHIQVPVTDAVTAVTPSGVKSKGTSVSATAMETVSTGVGQAAPSGRKLLPIVIGVSVGAVVVVGALATVIFFMAGEPPPKQPEPPASDPEPPAQGPAVAAPDPDPTPAAEVEAGVQPDDIKEEAPEEPPEMVAEGSEEKKVAKKGGKKGKAGSNASKSGAKATKKGSGKTGDKVVKGRFGTTFVGEYDE
jgi:serine/threonine-protein kinase